MTLDNGRHQGRLAQRMSAEAAAALVRSGDWVDYGPGLAQPDAFDTAMAERIGELGNVNIRGCLSTRPRAVVEADPAREHVSFFNWHLGGYDRKQSDEGLQNYIPCNLGEIPDYYRRFIDPPDVMVIKTCPLDTRGLLQLQRGEPVARSGRFTGQGRHCRDRPGTSVPSWYRQRTPYQPGRLRHRWRRPALT